MYVVCIYLCIYVRGVYILLYLCTWCVYTYVFMYVVCIYLCIYVRGVYTYVFMYVVCIYLCIYVRGVYILLYLCAWCVYTYVCLFFFRDLLISRENGEPNVNSSRVVTKRGEREWDSQRERERGRDHTANSSRQDRDRCSTYECDVCFCDVCGFFLYVCCSYRQVHTNAMCVFVM